MTDAWDDVVRAELDAMTGGGNEEPAAVEAGDVLTLLDLRDAEGERLRVEADPRDGRAYLTIGEPNAERPFTLTAAACHELARVLVGHRSAEGQRRVKQATAAVKTGSA